MRRGRCDSVLNISSGRCVLRNGRVGKSLRGRLRSCRSCLNVRTNRCVPGIAGKRGGVCKGSVVKRSGKGVVRSGRIKALTCIPSEMHGLMKECECQKRWRKMTRIGSGAYGSAYHACSVTNSKDCEYVVKVQSNNATAKRELNAYMRLRGSSVVPKMHAAWLCRGRMYIVLDRMFECKVSLKELKDVLNRFLRLGWLHVDVHPGNVMCNKKGNICLIDLGWAVHKDDQPYKGHPTGERSFNVLKEIQDENVEDFW